MKLLKADYFKGRGGFTPHITSSKKLCGGFTLIETMIVVSIMVIVSTMLLTSAKSNQSQIALSTGQAVISGTLNKAKSMALAKWNPSGNEANSACGFGVHFDVSANTLVLFQDLPTCNNPYAPNEAVQTINLDPRVEFSGSQADIVFSAPYLNTSGARTITLKMKNNPTQMKSVQVTEGGSITSL
ncbi:type II secretion system protein [bacterium]|nr:MAG: type II secretion system protein [bacterium]